MAITQPRSYLRYTVTVDRARVHSLCAEQVLQTPHAQPGATVGLVIKALAGLFEPALPEDDSPAIRCRLPKVIVSGIGISHRKGFTDQHTTVRITPRIRLLEADRQTRVIEGSPVDIPFITAAQDTYDNEATQITAMIDLIDEILHTAAASLNRSADFYARAFTPPEPETITLAARRLNDNCTLVGEADGTSAVLDNEGADDRGLQRIRTEHGLLLLDPEAEMVVLDEVGVPSEEPEMCHHMTYRATTTTPAEYCDNEALPGSDYCVAHDRYA